MERLHESPAWATAAIIVIGFLVIGTVGNFDYTYALLDEANEKEQRPLRVALELARKDKHQAVGTLLACLDGQRIQLVDGRMTHVADCTPYKIRTAIVAQRP